MAEITVTGGEPIVALAALAVRLRRTVPDAHAIYVDHQPGKQLRVNPSDDAADIVHRWHCSQAQAG